MRTDFSARLHAAAILLFVVACSRTDTPPREPAGGRDDYVRGAGDVRLFPLLDGAGSDTIVVLHGGPGLNLESLRPDLEPLARNHVLLHFDQRGTGRSEMPDTLQLTVEAMVDDLEALRRHFGLERMTLLGHSWGGGLALLYAMAHPSRVERIVLVGSLPLRGTPWGQQYFATQSSRRDSAENRRLTELDSLTERASDPRELCREKMRLFLKGVSATPATASRIKGDICGGPPENIRKRDLVNRRVFQSFLAGSPPDWDWRARAESIAAPTLVIHGAEDALSLASAEEMVATLRNARLVVIPGAGHYPHAERADSFFPAVEAWLATRRPWTSSAN